VLRKQVYDSAKRPHPAVEEAQELLRFWDLVLQWSRRNIKLRYKRSILGVLWTLLEPLMLMTILTIVFSNVFRFDGLDYPFPLYILSGLLLFDFFNRSTLQIVEETVASLGLASRIYVPRSAFAVATVLTYLVNWAIALIPLVAIMMVLRQPLSWAILTIPFGMLLSSLFALGVGLLVATLGAFFHDVKLTYQVLLTGWFYATPIIYPLEIVPAPFEKYFLLNPLLHLVALVREPVIFARVAPLENWMAAGGFSLAALALGWWVFTTQRSVFDYRS
jgi:ABC-type polysaccharide/polyol phosphate export permease